MTAERDKSFDGAARLICEIPAAVALFDRDLRYVAASPRWGAAFGLPLMALAGQRHDDLCKIGSVALSEVQRHALAGETVDDYPTANDELPQTSRRIMLGARPHRGLDDKVAGVVVAAQVLELADPVRRLPDPLTGLPERHEFAQHLREALADPDTARRGVAAFAINLDGFRSINNLYGVTVGDEVLKVTAERLVAGTRSRLANEARAAWRGTDMVARLGGDEFGVICGPPALSPAEAEGLAARLLRLIQHPIATDSGMLRLTASIGFIMTGEAHSRADDALRDLDFALLQAKALGPSKVVAWEASLTHTATRRCSLAEQLRRGFDNGEFLLHYQPILRLSDERMVGTEALLRWNHPSEGLVASGAFVPLLEETGLIVEVGCWVIREAVQQIESWRMLYGRDFVDWVSVNLSARQFNDPSALLATVRGIHDSGFSVHRLKFEITETTLMRSPEIARAVLSELRAMGIRIAIDDFGTGYSALNSLQQYPADTIKIDREFVAQIGSAEGDKLALALLDIAHMYGATVVAEGIETTAQRDFLRAGGCGLGQGYLFAKPMDGALLGAYALTHAVSSERGAGQPPPRRPPVARPLSLSTSAGP